MTRSKWKSYFFDNSIYRNLKNKKKVLYIWSRSSTILSIFINKLVYVYNGKSFEKLNITKDMIGYKFGDFIFTKKRGKFIHKIIKKKKKKK